MHIGYYKYRADILPDTQGIPPTYYRGYVEHYVPHENKKMQYPCDRVRTNRQDALNDAKTLLKNLSR